VIEHACDALHDRQAESQPARGLGAFVQPVKFLEDFALLRGRNADAGVPDVDPQAAAAAPATDQHASLAGEFDGIGDKILNKAAQQPAVRANRQRTRNENKFEALFAREGSEFHLDLAQQFVDPERADFRLQGAGVEA
jgi:hypothetical protein